MNAHDYITVLLAPGPANKRVNIVDGQTVKCAGAPISWAEAYTVLVPDANAFAKVLHWIADRENAVLIQGYAPGAAAGERYVIMSRKQIEAHTCQTYSDGWVEINGTRTLGRLKTNFHPSSWWQLDRDYAEGIPDALGRLSNTEWVNMISRIMPGFDSAARIRVASTSGRVVRDGKPLDSQGCRYWFQVQDPTDFDFGSRLKMQAAINGLGFMKLNSVGIGTLWAPFDPTVFSWERVVFDGKPVAGTGLKLRAPDITVSQGGRVDTRLIPELTLNELEQLDQEYGTRLRISRNGQVSEVQVGNLQLDTPIETCHYGQQTPRTFYQAGASKWRCQSTFRESSTWNGYLFQDFRGMPVLYDNGTRTRYELSRAKQVELAANGRSMHE